MSVSAPAHAATAGTRPAAVGAVASAVPGSRPPDDGGGVTVCGDVTSSDVTGGAVYLPVNRWGGVSGQHTRLSSAWTADIAQKIQKNGTVSSFLAFGNTAFQWSTNLTQWATRMCLADSASYRVDQMVAKVGQSLMSSGVVTLLLVAAVALIFWRALRRSASPARAAGQSLLSLGLLAVLVNGASHTTDASFGKFSPGWFATRAQAVVAQAASVPAAALDGFVTVPTSPMAGSALDCSYYRQALLNRYDRAYGPSPVEQSQAVVPKILSSMWETTGERAYVTAQFGAQNPYGAKVFCRLMDQKAGIPVGDVSTDRGVLAGQQTVTKDGLTLAGVSGVTVKPGTMPWTMTDSLSEDRTIIAYAACNVGVDGSWSVDAAWQAVGDAAPANQNKKLKPVDCQRFWSDAQVDPSNGPFNWEDDPRVIVTDAASQPAVENFLLSWHGNDNGGAIAAAVTYLVAALVILGVFGVLSLVLIVAKIAVLGLMFAVIFVLLKAIVPGLGSDDALSHVVRAFLGTTLVTFGAGLLIAFIAVLTGFLQDVGN
ncbi:MAG: hypothetical protein WCG47_29800, partial [Dermatophilaceae bacterium]